MRKNLDSTKSDLTRESSCKCDEVGRSATTTENRGVPGSSPGLAIHERPAKSWLLQVAAPGARSVQTLPWAFRAFSALPRPASAESGQRTNPVGRRVVVDDRVTELPAD